ncbi:DUF4351 domain-containing protein [Anabaena sp. UHCC 0204]|uniref:DUF4351 domain-containing protein n=1 Tax=Anabaena sp. UHCC 0204 TaxID=2590009 RepID=UPI001445C523|nr:DUF4351 domain-containing protein [Anabaena sp. UHCC 0204]MTJ10015.1 DUF4351 domain-containing protein [Anabaena sp. UHCC 0204]
MTRFIHDQFAKDYLEELLKPFGKVEAPSRVSGEAREIDVSFSPFSVQNANIKVLGLLGTIAATPAIFEPFRNPASKEEICSCILKLLEIRGAFQRQANRQKTTVTELDIPKLWIITPTASTKLLSGFGTIQKVDWLPGVHFLPDSLGTAIIVVHQLPSTEETLWLRVLGRETVQRQAVDELAALPTSHPFKKVMLELLYNFQQNLRANQNLEPDDRELIMRLAPLYQQDREKAIQEGEERGLQQGEQRVIIRQLNRRIGELSSSLVVQIQGLSLEQLDLLGEALLDFSEVADLETWLKQL